MTNGTVVVSTSCLPLPWLSWFTGFNSQVKQRQSVKKANRFAPLTQTENSIFMDKNIFTKKIWFASSDEVRGESKPILLVLNL